MNNRHVKLISHGICHQKLVTDCSQFVMLWDATNKIFWYIPHESKIHSASKNKWYFNKSSSEILDLSFVIKEFLNTYHHGLVWIFPPFLRGYPCYPGTKWLPLASRPLDNQRFHHLRDFGKTLKMDLLNIKRAAIGLMHVILMSHPSTVEKTCLLR